jgi:hypothetical protein
MGSTIGEVDPRAHDEILDRVGGQDLARPGESRYAGADVDGDPFDSRLGELDLTRVQPGADLDPELANGIADRSFSCPSL